MVTNYITEEDKRMKPYKKINLDFSKKWVLGIVFAIGMTVPGIANAEYRDGSIWLEYALLFEIADAIQDEPYMAQSGGFPLFDCESMWPHQSPGSPNFNNEQNTCRDACYDYNSAAYLWNELCQNVKWWQIKAKSCNTIVQAMAERLSVLLECLASEGKKGVYAP